MLLAGVLFTAAIITSCQEDNSATTDNLVSKEVLARIWELGYNNENVQKIEEGYLVEGDIILTEENLLDHSDHTTLRIAETEQYRTTNLVTGVPRVITVSMGSTLAAVPGYSSALTTAIAR